MDDMDTIYRQYAQTVYHFLLSQTHDEALAEELTQETFYQAIRSLHRFDGSCKLSVWLCQIAKHLWYQHLRRAKRETAMEDLPEPLVPSAEETTLSGDSQIRLLKRVHALPEAQKEVVYLRSFGGLSFKEIGAVLGRTETWARVTFHRGREALRKEADRDEK